MEKLNFSCGPVRCLKLVIWPTDKKCCTPLRYTVSLVTHETTLRSPSLLYKAFLRPLLTYALPGWFDFLSITNFTKLERIYRAACRAITGCLSSSPIPLLLSEASLPPLQITLTHFTFSSFEWALCLPISFPISSSPPFPLHAPALIPLSLRCGFHPP